MAKATVTTDFSIPADKLWALVRDFGNVSWVQGASDTAVEGEGVGMVRIFKAGDGPPIRERLEALDDAARSLTYTIPENLPLPVKDYTSTMTVTPKGDGCTLEWTCVGEPDGVSEQQMVEAIQGMYTVMTGWIKELVGSS
jgi:hypothetical protein